jgi:P27 family predicted phage terminase small subunit
MSGRGGARLGAGRKPKPTRLKELLTGKKSASSALLSEPQPDIPAGIPEPPEELDDRAKRHWYETAKKLKPLGLLTNLDLDQLAMYCSAYSRWLTALTQLRQKLIVMSPNEYPMLSPYLSIEREAISTMQKCSAEFGMSPASRTRINVKRAAQDPPKAPLPAPGIEKSPNPAPSVEDLRQKFVN